MKYFFIFILILFLGIAGCVEEGGGNNIPHEQGYENGECYEDGYCEEGLVCSEDNICVKEEIDKCANVDCDVLGEKCNPDNGKCELEKRITSDGIYVAVSNQTEPMGLSIFSSPVIYGKYVFIRLFREAFMGQNDRTMKFIAYDLSKFTEDKLMDDLKDKVLYEQSGPNYTDNNFNQRYYPPLEDDGYLYFQVMPENKEAMGQNEFIKYDLNTMEEVYHAKDFMVFDEDKNTTADLARGFFVPFDGDKIAIVEDGVTKVINKEDGSIYAYDGYDYFSYVFSNGSYTDFYPPVSYGDGYFINDGKLLYKIKYLADGEYVEYGRRKADNDPFVLKTDVFEDFKNQYQGNTDYKDFHLGKDSPVLDGNDLYFFALLEYEKDGETFPQSDLYLFNYDTDLNFKSATLLDTTRYDMLYNTSNYFKYGNILYFKYHSFEKEELCALNLIDKSFIFRHQIGNHKIVDERILTEYTVTGDNIVLPEIIDRNSEKYPYSYDIVFKVLKSDSGEELKTLRHKELYAFMQNYRNINIRWALNDENAVYFFAVVNSENNTVNNMIIKIDSPDNKIVKTKYRFDNSMTSVLK